MEWIKKKIITDFYFDDKIDLKVRMLRLIGFYTIAAMIFLSPVF